MTDEEKEKLKNFLWDLVVTIENSSQLPANWITEKAKEIQEMF